MNICRIRSTISAIAFLLGVTAALPAFAVWQYSREEVKLLPPYCEARAYSGRNSPEWKYWRQRLGKNFDDVHHYCNGIWYMKKYYAARSRTDKGHNLQEALGDLSYMVQAARPGFVLLPDVYLERARVFMLRKDNAKALADVEKSIALNPTRVSAHLLRIDLFEVVKAPDKALAAASDALRYLPGNEELQKRYLALGGTQPFPEPVKPTPTDGSANQASPNANTAPTTAYRPAGQPRTKHQRY